MGCSTSKDVVIPLGDIPGKQSDKFSHQQQPERKIPPNMGNRPARSNSFFLPQPSIVPIPSSIPSNKTNQSNPSNHPTQTLSSVETKRPENIPQQFYSHTDKELPAIDVVSLNRTCSKDTRGCAGKKDDCYSDPPTCYGHPPRCATHHQNCACPPPDCCDYHDMIVEASASKSKSESESDSEAETESELKFGSPAGKSQETIINPLPFGAVAPTKTPQCSPVSNNISTFDGELFLPSPSITTPLPNRFNAQLRQVMCLSPVPSLPLQPSQQQPEKNAPLQFQFNDLVPEPGNLDTEPGSSFVGATPAPTPTTMIQTTTTPTTTTTLTAPMFTTNASFRSGGFFYFLFCLLVF